MKGLKVTIGIAIFAFATGAFVSPMIGWYGPPNGATASEDGFGLPAAVEKMWFPPISEYDIGGESLDEGRFEQLMDALDAGMAAEETLADFAGEANFHLINFSRRLAVPEITEPQQERIADYLTALGEKHPDHLQLIDGWRSFVAAQFPPKSPDQVPVFSRRVDLFFAAPDLYTDGGAFEDAQVDELLARLRRILSVPEVTDRFEKEADDHLWNFARFLQGGLLSPGQVARIVSYLDEVAEEHPEGTDVIQRTRYVVENLVPGQVAPNIVGKDTEGEQFELDKYRGSVVALVFSGHWCGPCRAEYPFQRAMMSLYEDTSEDVVLLSVNSDPVLDTIRAVKERERLASRTWWDGYGELSIEGPIATDWHVSAWPTTYILDEEGVIRFVDKRGAKMIAAVDELLQEKRWAAFEASLVAPAGNTTDGKE